MSGPGDAGDVGVAGATGFVGAAILGAAPGARPIRQPRVTDASGDDLADPVAAARRWCDEHPRAYGELLGQLDGCRALVNAAGRADPGGRDEAALFAANAVLPVVLALAARQAGVRRFVHLSSGAVQGRLPLSARIEYQPVSPYARSKIASERGLRALGGSGPCELVIYRPPSVIAASRPTAAGLRRVARLPVVPVLRPDAPVPTAQIGNVARFALHLATTDDPPAVCTHPSEGMTVRSLLEAASAAGRPRLLDLSWLDAGAGTAFAAACRVERVAPAARRLEILLRGQQQLDDGPAAAEYDWLDGPEGYLRELRSSGRDPSLVRIAFVITRSDTFGGAHVHVVDMAAALQEAGHDVKVFVGGDGPYTAVVKGRGVPYASVRGLSRGLGVAGDLIAVRELRTALAAFSPDLVSTHSSKAGVLGRIAARSLGVPTLFTAHGWAFAEGVDDRLRRPYAAVERVAARFGSAIVCVSEADLKLAESYRVGARTSRHVIRNGVRDVAERWRAEPGRDPMRAVMVARLDDQKDHQTLIAALSMLPRPPEVLLVGDGPLEHSLRRRCDELGLSGVRFLGRRTDVHELMSEAQLFLLISNWEGLPRSIIEAMRAGLPVVATAVGGVAELVGDDTGVLVAPKDAEAVAAAIERLQADPDLRSTMGRAARSTYETRYRLSRLVSETVAVYEGLLQRPIRRPAESAGPAFLID